MGKLTRVFAIILLLALAGCKNDLDFVDHQDNINYVAVKQTTLDRGILTVKSETGNYHFYSWSPLIYTDTFPDWIQDQHSPDYRFNNYKFEPILSDIDVPYIISKK